MTYVDFIICHEKKSVIKKLGDDLNRFFDILDLGDLPYFLGIRNQRTDYGSFLLDQEKKVNQLVQEFSLEDGAPMNTDYTKLIGNEECLPNNEKYRRAVGVLLYLSTVSRPDIATGVGYLTRRVSNPRQIDWNAVKRMIRYLKGTNNFKLKMKSDVNMILKGYVDSDWAGDVFDRKSVSGFVLFLGKNHLS
ncbi:hypothetical protein JTB14_020971 [Gonioctena quinquepunctata]|nr:hypothetical protein JTB14_020971 [Gonioctena quinquepunctata]